MVHRNFSFVSCLRCQNPYKSRASWCLSELPLGLETLERLEKKKEEKKKPPKNSPLSPAPLQEFARSCRKLALMLNESLKTSPEHASRGKAIW